MPESIKLDLRLIFEPFSFTYAIRWDYLRLIKFDKIIKFGVKQHIINLICGIHILLCKHLRSLSLNHNTIYRASEDMKLNDSFHAQYSYHTWRWERNCFVYILSNSLKSTVSSLKDARWCISDPEKIIDIL